MREEEMILVLPGTESERIPIAITKVEIVFTNEDDLKKCIAVLRDSDAQLKTDPKPYDWQFTVRKGLKIYFGVNWFDLNFFKEKKDVFENKQHGSIFQSFNSSIENFVVRHYIEYH
ncbi:hypothetical protein H7992_07255 [Sporosarcina sp. resist]|uniref:hypothetical protein n=1 Tax=Sporosarcina sp. resist TaxID=2762563 RepID=UPI00164DC5BA|nr:hypothetical protein [Sporosarcina sp. resist]QNK89455.1 hypothetical protein H7992_07255 [Sporosarcina sp. resist]